MKSCWGYIYLSWLLENIEFSGRFGELSPADAFRRWILAVCGKRHLYICHCHTARQLESFLILLVLLKLEHFTRKSSQPVTRDSSNVPFYQLVNTCARGIPLPLNFCRVSHMLLVYGGVKFGMVWTPWGFVYSKTQISNFATRGEASYLQLERHLSVHAIQIYWPHLRDGPMWEWGAKPNPQTLRTRKQLERDSSVDLLTNIGQHPSFVHFEFLSRT